MVIGDAGGPGRPMCDSLRESGIRVIYFNFGGKCTGSVHHNEGTRAWYKVAKMIRDGELMPPPRNHPSSAKLLAQLTSRRQKMHSSGKLWMEEKSEMRNPSLRGKCGHPCELRDRPARVLLPEKSDHFFLPNDIEDPP